MSERQWFGQIVRDRRSGVSGRVVGRVEWDEAPPSLIVQPPVRDDRTVPPTVYVIESCAEPVPQPYQGQMTN